LANSNVTGPELKVIKALKAEGGGTCPEALRGTALAFTAVQVKTE
jgi:hypothetical protein